MADCIVEVHSISSAAGWYLQDYTAASLADLKAVTCFALVSSFDGDYPSLGNSRKIVPLSIDDMNEELIGKEIKLLDVVHEVEARATLER